MAVRDFDGVDDDIVCATGGLSTNTFGTFAALIRRTAVGRAQWDTILGLHTSAGTGQNLFGIQGLNATTLYQGGVNADGPAIFDTTNWRLIVVRKASGTVTPRFSVYNLGTQAWTHAAGSTTIANWTAPGSGGSTRFRFDASDYMQCRIAVRAAWNTVRWSADTAGDTDIQNAGLHRSLDHWVGSAPSALWRFDQRATTEAVLDLTGGGANQTSITGTAVITNDDPPGFRFDRPLIRPSQHGGHF